MQVPTQIVRAFDAVPDGHDTIVAVVIAHRPDPPGEDVLDPKAREDQLRAYARGFLADGFARDGIGAWLYGADVRQETAQTIVAVNLGPDASTDPPKGSTP